MLRLLVGLDNLKHSARSAMSRLRHDDAGVTAIEYGLIAGAIAVAIIAVVIALGGDIKTMFTSTSTALKSTGAK